MNWPEPGAGTKRSRDVAIADDFDGNEKIIYPHVSTSACVTPRNERGRERGLLLKTESEAGG